MIKYIWRKDMNDEEELINYIKNCYEIYSKSNFESIVNYCYSFGTKHNQYNKDISKSVYLIVNNVINTLKLKKITHSHKEYKKSVKINIIFERINYPSTKAKIYVPVYLDNCERVLSIILRYIIENKYNCNIKLSKIINNELLVINFEDCKVINKFFDFYSGSKELKKEEKNIISCLIPKKSGFGICSEIYPYNYLDTFNNYLCLYYNNIKSVEEINLKSVIAYFENCYNKEKIILKKEMLKKIILCINSIIDISKINSIFDYNGEMNIGSFNPSDYNLLLSEKKILYFENKEKTFQINFGTEEYLNICYSFFYKNIISKNSASVYYVFFRSIYINLLEKKFENIKDLYNIDISEDLIYKELALMASGYFVYKKLNFDYKEIYLILKKVLELNLLCNINLDEDNSEEINNNKIEFPFNIEYAGKLVTLKDGSAVTIINYFNNNGVLKYIPLNSKINLKDGTTISAEVFLKELYKIIPEYNNFMELFDKKIDFIEYSN